MYKSKFFWAVFLSGAIMADACGPEFPNQLLTDRGKSMKEMPINSFANDIAQVAETSRLNLPTDFTEKWYDDSRDVRRAKAESIGLTVQQVQQIMAMRASANGAESYAKGESLPLAIRLYTAGAVDFNKKNSQQAEQRFKAILALPDAERKPRAVWAAYMLGRLYLKRVAFQIDGCNPCKGLGDAMQPAAQFFALARTLARQGAADPLLLALESYRDEIIFYETFDENDATFFSRRLKLLVEYAAQDNLEARKWLKRIARETLDDEKLLNARIGDPLVQQFLAIYALHYPGASDSAKRAESILSKLLKVIEKQQIKNFVAADRLAMLAYRQGRYKEAATLADQASTPQAAWVRAKLALQRGELDVAAAEYSHAAKGFATAGSVLAPRARRVGGEQGILYLSRGEYVTAMGYLYEATRSIPQDEGWEGVKEWSGYWADVAYVAEHVLTADELITFVDKHAAEFPAVDVVPPREGGAINYYTLGGLTDRRGLDYARVIFLRNVLARRLMREGRYREALPYFPEPTDPYAPYPQARQWAKQYAEAMHQAHNAWTDTGRAEGWLLAGRLARRHGMEIMGYEGYPDQTFVSGLFSDAIGPEEPWGKYIGDDDDATEPEESDTENTEDDSDVHDKYTNEPQWPQNDYMGKDEYLRYAMSRPSFNQRFHYRRIAVEHGKRAADLLPPRSQAFAAVLCEAAAWSKARDPEQEQVLYRRYVQQGAANIPGMEFGHRCPPADFASVRYKSVIEGWRHIKQQIKNHCFLTAGSGLLVPITVALFWTRWRRQPAPNAKI